MKRRHNWRSFGAFALCRSDCGGKRRQYEEGENTQSKQLMKIKLSRSSSARVHVRAKGFFFFTLHIPNTGKLDLCHHKQIQAVWEICMQTAAAETIKQRNHISFPGTAKLQMHIFIGRALWNCLQLHSEDLVTAVTVMTKGRYQRSAGKNNTEILHDPEQSESQDVVWSVSVGRCSDGMTHFSRSLTHCGHRKWTLKYVGK